MCGVVKCVVLLLVAVGSNAAPTTEECEVLTRRLQTKDVYTNFGDWVLVWAVSDYELGSGLLANLSSSRASFQLLVPNSRTIVYKEKNTFSDGTCASFFFNLHVPSDPKDSTLQVKSGTLLKHGSVRAITSTSVVFYETGPESLLMLYQGPLGRYLLSYRRDGHHSDMEQLKAAHDDLRKLAECVGFAHDKPFIYDGAAGPTCKQCDGVNSRLPTKDLHKVYGSWVLVWSVSDLQVDLDLISNLSSSHIEFHLLPDKNTVVLNARNVYTYNSCFNYVINLALPSDPSDPGHHTLHMVSATVEEDGVVKPYNVSAVLDFYQTCPDCLLMVYKHVHGRYLLSYRRDGHHSDVEQLKAAHDDLRKQSECLGFQHHNPFIYDGEAAVGYKAVPTCKKCEGLNSRLPTKNLDQVFGTWVLVWSVLDHDKDWDHLPNVSSSHVELQLLPDKRGAVFNERNLYKDKSCSNYVINLALPSDPSDPGHHTLHMVSATVEEDGVVKPYNDSAALDFYQTCPDCLLMVYKNVDGRYLLSYRRDGHHSDVEQLKAAHDDLRKQSECLGFQHHNPFIYDGEAAVGYKAVPTCKKCEGLNSRLPTKNLDQVFGTWVLVWSVSDHDKGWDLLQNVSSSHVELQLLPDKRGAVFNERNLYKDKSCSNYVINLALPSDPSDPGHHTLHMVSATVEVDGVVKPYNDSAVLDFYQTCPDCLLVVYKYVHGRYLLSYRKEGHHSDAQRLKAAHDDHRKQSECLGFQHHNPFIYDGEAEFCHKKSASVKHQAS